MKNIYAIFEYSPETGLFAFVQSIADLTDFATCHEIMAECAKSYVIDRIGKLNFVDTIGESRPISSYKPGSFVIRKNRLCAGSTKSSTLPDFEINVYKIETDAGWTSNAVRPVQVAAFRVLSIALPECAVRDEEVAALTCALNDANEYYEAMRDKLFNCEAKLDAAREELRMQMIFSDSMKLNAEMLEDCIVDKNQVITQLQEKIESRNAQIDSLEVELAMSDRKNGIVERRECPKIAPLTLPSYDKVISEIKNFNRHSLKRFASANDISGQCGPITQKSPNAEADPPADINHILDYASTAKTPLQTESSPPKMITAAMNHQHYITKRWHSVAKNTIPPQMEWDWLEDCRNRSISEPADYNLGDIINNTLRHEESHKNNSNPFEDENSEDALFTWLGNH